MVATDELVDKRIGNKIEHNLPPTTSEVVEALARTKPNNELVQKVCRFLSSFSRDVDKKDYAKACLTSPQAVKCYLNLGYSRDFLYHGFPTSNDELDKFASSSQTQFSHLFNSLLKDLSANDTDVRDRAVCELRQLVEQTSFIGVRRSFLNTGDYLEKLTAIGKSSEDLVPIITQLIVGLSEEKMVNSFLATIEAIKSMDGSRLCCLLQFKPCEKVTQAIRALEPDDFECFSNKISSYNPSNEEVSKGLAHQNISLAVESVPTASEMVKSLAGDMPDNNVREESITFLVRASLDDAKAFAGACLASSKALKRCLALKTLRGLLYHAFPTSDDKLNTFASSNQTELSQLFDSIIGDLNDNDTGVRDRAVYELRQWFIKFHGVRKSFLDRDDYLERLVAAGKARPDIVTAIVELIVGKPKNVMADKLSDNNDAIKSMDSSRLCCLLQFKPCEEVARALRALTPCDLKSLKGKLDAAFSEDSTYKEEFQKLAYANLYLAVIDSTGWVFWQTLATQHLFWPLRAMVALFGNIEQGSKQPFHGLTPFEHEEMILVLDKLSGRDRLEVARRSYDLPTVLAHLTRSSTLTWAQRGKLAASVFYHLMVLTLTLAVAGYVFAKVLPIIFVLVILWNMVYLPYNALYYYQFETDPCPTNTRPLWAVSSYYPAVFLSYGIYICLFQVPAVAHALVSATITLLPMLSAFGATAVLTLGFAPAVLAVVILLLLTAKQLWQTRGLPQGDVESDIYDFDSDCNDDGVATRATSDDSPGCLASLRNFWAGLFGSSKQDGVVLSLDGNKEVRYYDELGDGRPPTTGHSPD